MEAEVNDEDQNGKEQDEDIAEEDGKEESVLGGEYMSAEDEDVLLGTGGCKCQHDFYEFMILTIIMLS